MYLPDPAATLRGVATLLLPGGLMVLHEHDSTMTPASTAAFPLRRRRRAGCVQCWDIRGRICTSASTYTAS